MHRLLLIFSWLLLFVRNVWGSIQKPYETYRRLSQEDPGQLIILFVFIALYFFGISPVKFRTFHPFVLTVHAGRLFTAVLGSYLFTCFLFYVVGVMLKVKSQFKTIMLTWGYSLIPTLMWFLVTSVFYVLLPPPRHETFLGKSFSVLFIAFSIALLYWKAMLYYLTLRFALKLDLSRITIASSLILPTLALYSWVLYSWGVFRVPFI